MTDLDNLRTALRTPPPEECGALDIERIMSAGKRIRRRRRVQGGAGIVAVAAAVVLVVAGADRLKTDTPAAVGGPSLTTSAPVATLDPSQEAQVPLGDVISTGIRDPLGERVFYVVKVNLPVELPDTHFGLMAGHRTADGQLTSEQMSNEVTGSDRRPGFHVLDGGDLVRGQFLPVSGYYVGPAEKITTTVHGNTVEARLAKWSEDPSIVVFWFTQEDVPSSVALTPPLAFGKDSAKLPS
jgi:hypothetical protein